MFGSRKKSTRSTKTKTPPPAPTIPDDEDDGRGRLVEPYDPNPAPVVIPPRPKPDPVKTWLDIRELPLEGRRWLLRKLAEQDADWLCDVVIMYKHEDDRIRDIFRIAVEGLADLSKKLRSRNSCIYSKRAKTAKRVEAIETAMKSGLTDWEDILAYMKEHHAELVQTKTGIIDAISLKRNYRRAKKPKPEKKPPG